MSEIKQIWCEEDQKFYPETMEENGRTYVLDKETWTYLEDVELKLTPREEDLMKEPIGRYGRAWRRFMEENYPLEIPSLKVKYLWELIPRQVEKEAREQYFIISENWAKANQPRPTDFTECAKWEKMKQLEADHEVMTEIVLQYRNKLTDD